MILRSLILFTFFFTSCMLDAAPTKNETKKTQKLIAKKAKINRARRYQTMNYPAPLPGGNTFLQGIKETKYSHKKVFIAGYFVTANGITTVPFVYKGGLSGKGDWHTLSFPTTPGKTVTATHLYGPNKRKNSTIYAVGDYTTAETGPSLLGCLYQGHLDNSGKWKTLAPPASSPLLNTTAHSVMDGVVVGIYNTQPLLQNGFLYDIKRDKYHHIKKPGSISTTAYGIWHNDDDSFTISGGYSDSLTSSPLIVGYLVDWNRKRGEFSNWRSFHFNNSANLAARTRFHGLTTDGKGGYYVTGVWSPVAIGPDRSFFAHIKKGKHAKWAPISLPGQLVTTAFSVYKKNVVGTYISPITNSNNGFVSTPD